MRVAVFRAAADGVRTAARLSERGHEAVLAPVIRIERTGVPVEVGDVQALVFTSAHAPAVLADDPALPDLRALPCWCVGGRTASAARALGFEAADADAGDAGQLADLLAARLGPRTRLLLLVGRDRKPTLEARLAATGMSLRVTEVYDAAAMPAFSEATVAALRTCDAALHYSRRSAALAASLAGAHDLLDHMRGWTHYCLSPDVAEALQPLGFPCACASTPTEASLLEALGVAAPSSSPLAPSRPPRLHTGRTIPSPLAGEGGAQAPDEGSRGQRSASSHPSSVSRLQRDPPSPARGEGEVPGTEHGCRSDSVAPE